MKILITLILALCVVVTVGFTQSKSPQWEYKFQYSVNEKQANEWGAQGWELVAIDSTNVRQYAFKRAR